MVNERLSIVKALGGTEPCGAYGIPLWQYRLRLYAECLRAEPPLSRSVRDHIAELLEAIDTTLTAQVSA
jgi:hypothetical protein